MRVPTEAEDLRRLLTHTREQLMNKKHRVMVQIRMQVHYFGLFPAIVRQRIKLHYVDKILVSRDGELQHKIGMLRDEWIKIIRRVKEIECL